MRSVYLIFFLCTALVLPAQSPDSLLKKLAGAGTDTAKITFLNKLTDYYLGDKNDSAAYFNDRSITLSLQKKLEKHNFDGFYLKAQLRKLEKKYTDALEILTQANSIARLTGNDINKARVLRLTGSIYDAQNKEKEAIEKYLESLDLCKAIKNKDGMLSSNIALGLYFKKHLNNTNALQYFLDAHKIANEIHDSTSIFTCLVNLGTLYEQTDDKEKALAFYRKALLINEKDNDENGKAISYFKIGRMYYNLKKPDSANFFLNKTLQIHLKRNDEPGLIFDYSFLASSFDLQGNREKALENWNKALQLALKHQDSIRVNIVYSYMGVSEMRRKEYKKAYGHFIQSLQYACSTVPIKTMASIYENLASISEKTGQYTDAYKYHVLYKTWSDSSYNISDTKKQTELKLGFEFNQVQEKMVAESEAKELKNKAEIEKQQQQRNFLLVGLGLISLLFVVAFRSYRTKQKANSLLEKQKVEIEHQKKLVEEKNHEISDSINYALRIQTASLPEKKELAAYFNNYALFFKPKDIVSGDFYWAAGDENNVIIAIADCTGHGVPGAITSIIGSMLLNEIYYVKKLTRPNEVLKELNRLVKLTLRQEGESLSKDGMDIAFCLWDKKANKLLYAGANRPIYILRNNELTEHKPSKISVGGYVPLLQDYDLNTIDLQSGDTLVMTSDGYADQFGGAKEKKFTTKAFKDMLREIASLPLAEKLKIVEERYIHWKGNQEQTDDVLVFMLQV